MPPSQAALARRSWISRILRRAGYAAALLVPVIVLLFFFVDRPVAETLRESRDSAIVRAFEFIEVAGEGTWYIVPGIVAAIVLYLFGSARWRVPLYIALCVAVSGIAVNVLKFGFGRYRPKRLFEDGEYGFTFFELASSARSFPSGHATTAFAVAAALTVLAPRFGVVWFAFGASIAASRVVTGAHYLGDVVAGAWLGTVTALLLAVYVFPDRPAADQTAQSENRARSDSRSSGDSSTTSAPPA